MERLCTHNERERRVTKRKRQRANHIRASEMPVDVKSPQRRRANDLAIGLCATKEIERWSRRWDDALECLSQHVAQVAQMQVVALCDLWRVALVPNALD